MATEALPGGLVSTGSSPEAPRRFRTGAPNPGPCVPKREWGAFSLTPQGWILVLQPVWHGLRGLLPSSQGRLLQRSPPGTQVVAHRLPGELLPTLLPDELSDRFQGPQRMQQLPLLWEVVWNQLPGLGNWPVPSGDEAVVPACRGLGLLPHGRVPPAPSA